MIWLLIGYMILFIHRPFEIWPILATIRLERMYILFTLLVAVGMGRVRFTVTPVHVGVLAMAVAITVSSLNSPWASSDDWIITLFDWSRYVVFYALVVSLVRDRGSLDWLITGFVIAAGMYVSHSVVEYHLGRHGFSMGVVRLRGINSELSHPNAFATLAIVAMPLAWHVARHAGSRVVRVGAAIYIPIAFYGVILTSSRTGIIGLAVVGLAVFWSHRKIRYVALGIAVAIGTWSLLPENKQDRVLSIVNQDIGRGDARTSAELRTESWAAGVRIFAKYTLTGCGPRHWREASGMKVNSHNLYGQVIGEIGLVGIIGFGTLVVTTVWQLRRLWRIVRESGDVEGICLAKSLALTFALLLLFGFAGGSLYKFYWLWIPAFTIAAHNALLVETRDLNEALG